MAEVPPHLLERSRARRSALGLAGGDAPATSATPAAPSPAAASGAAVVPVGAASPEAAAPSRALVPDAPAAPTPPPEPPRPRIPSWMLPVLVGLPVWVFGYVGMFAVQTSATVTPEVLGARTYVAQCASCHLSNGAGSDSGGVGRPLYNGEAEKTFPKVEDQIAFIKHGSCVKDQPYGDPKREGGQRIAQETALMPSFAATLSDAQIQAVVLYERTQLTAEPAPFPTGIAFPEEPNLVVPPPAEGTELVELPAVDPASVCPA